MVVSLNGPAWTAGMNPPDSSADSFVVSAIVADRAVFI